MEARIVKVDVEKRQVFGWASVSMREDGTLVEDSQGDLIDPEDLENAAYGFVLDYRQTGDMHQGSSKGRLIESMVFTPEKRAALDLPAGPTGWFLGFQLDDAAQWEMVKNGERPMFSIQGIAVREEV